MSVSELRLKGSIDIGSNTLRLLIGTYDPQKGIKVHHADRRITRLGQGLDKGFLLEERMQESIAAMSDFRKAFDDFGLLPDDLNIVATSAVRNARNGTEFVERVFHETGLTIRVIDGVEEARITTLGVSAAVRGHTPRLIVDIGGGSVELTLVDSEGKILHSVSREIGVVRLTEKFLSRAPLDIEEYLLLQEFVTEKISRIHDEFTRFPLEGLRIIGTAGTYTSVGFILSGAKEYNPKLINGYCVKVGDAKKLLEEMGSLGLAGRIERYGIEKGREDLIIAGMCLAINVNLCFEQEQFYVSDYGMREGALIAMYLPTT